MALWPRRHRAVLLLSILAVALSLTEARAQGPVGVCAVKISINYGTVDIASGTGSISFSSTYSLCAINLNIDDPPHNLVTTVTLNGTGTGSLAKSCVLTHAEGSYSATFGPNAEFADSNGVFEFVGNVTGGVLALIDIAPPIFAGVASLVFNPLAVGNIGAVTNCPGPGTTTIAYKGVLGFTDIVV